MLEPTESRLSSAKPQRLQVTLRSYYCQTETNETVFKRSETRVAALRVFRNFIQNRTYVHTLYEDILNIHLSPSLVS